MPLLAVSPNATPFAPARLCERMTRVSEVANSKTSFPSPDPPTPEVKPPMTYAEATLPEFDHEMAGTRKVLERIPDDKLDWRAHAKSNTIGWNANHIADLPGWSVAILTQPGYDFAPAGGEPYQMPALKTTREIVELFDRNVASARKALASLKDESLDEPWTLRGGDRIVFTFPRRAVIRGFLMNHIIHHRAILTVYLRLNDIPVPALYGPSGDEQ